MSIGGQIPGGGGHDFSQDGREYRITPIQHPTTGAAYGDQHMSRIALDPPLILQLDTWDSDQQLIIPEDALPHLLCLITLQSIDGEDASRIRMPDGGTIVDMLGSSRVSPVYQMTSQTGHPGVYFVFPDIAVARPGIFRLKCVLLPMTGGTYIDFCVTDRFTVYPLHSFVAPAQDTTEMTRHFAAQRIVPFLQMGHLREYWPDERSF